jgi:uncharacterized membrane protein
LHPFISVFCLTLGLQSKIFLLLRNWVHIVPIFLKLFSQHFFKVQVIDSVVVQTLLLFRFLVFRAAVQSEIIHREEENEVDLNLTGRKGLED